MCDSRDRRLIFNVPVMDEFTAFQSIDFDLTPEQGNYLGQNMGNLVRSCRID
jgi:hypothetical protein